MRRRHSGAIDISWMNCYLSKAVIEKQPLKVRKRDANAHPVGPGCQRAVPDNAFNGLIPGADVEGVSAIWLRGNVKTANAFDREEEEVDRSFRDPARCMKGDPKDKIISSLDYGHRIICGIEYLDPGDRKTRFGD